MIARELLLTGAKELRVTLSTEQVDSFFTYLAELTKWNQKINLTAITDERDMVIKHVLDSLSYMKGFSPRTGLKLLDMGSGAGFPAIPIKLAEAGIEITLVESVKKKASFLRHIARTLKLSGIDVRDQRTNELPESFYDAYDVVTARAFAEMSPALASGRPFLKPGGLLVLSRGPEETMEDQESRRLGFSLEKRLLLTLPHSDYKRAVWVFKREITNIKHD